MTSSTQIRFVETPAPEFLNAITKDFEIVFGRSPRGSAPELPMGIEVIPLRLLIFSGSCRAGWHFGRKIGARYEMTNTCVLPAFRRRGVYSALLAHLVAWSGREKVTELYSHHRPENDAIVRAKLRFGFRSDGELLHPALGILRCLKLDIPSPRK